MIGFVEILSSHADLFNWTYGPCKIFDVWFNSNIQLEKNWLESMKMVETTINLWFQMNLSFKLRSEMHLLSSSFINWLIQLLYIKITVLEKALLKLVWGPRDPILCHKVCCCLPSQGNLRMQKIWWHTLQLHS